MTRGAAIKAMVVGLLLVSCEAWSQVVAGAATQPQRLSEWLSTQSPLPNLATLHWRVPAERVRQNQWRQTALAGLPGHADALKVWLNALPLTGRVPLPSVHVDWLRRNPSQDPRIQWGQTPVVFSTSHAVGVLTSTGQACLAQVGAPVSLQVLLEGCGLAVQVGSVAQGVWVVLPGMQQLRGSVSDGEMPIPGGSWVWVSQTSVGDSASAALADLLATQAPPEHTLEQLGSLPNGPHWAQVDLRSRSHKPVTALESALDSPTAAAPQEALPAYPRAIVSGSSDGTTAWDHDVLRQTGWVVRSVIRDGSLVSVTLGEVANAADWPHGLERLTTVLNTHFDEGVSAFDVTLQRQGLVVRRSLVDRTEWRIQHTQWVPPSLRLGVETPMPLAQPSLGGGIDAGRSPWWQWEVSPNYWVGNAQGSRDWAQALSLDLDGQWYWGNGLGLQGRWQAPVAVQQGGAAGPTGQGLAPMRTRVAADWAARPWRIGSLTLTETQRMSGSLALHSYAGWVSPERVGLGAALSYQRSDSPWRFGFELHHLAARDPKRVFGSQGGAMGTGLVSAGVDLPQQNARVFAYAGRYLAGDRGVTLGMVKSLKPGVDWTTEWTHSTADAKPLWLMRWRVSWDALHRAWAWGGRADVQWVNRAGDGGARIGFMNPVFDVSVPLGHGGP